MSMMKKSILYIEDNLKHVKLSKMTNYCFATKFCTKVSEELNAITVNEHKW